jgi:hypothetical protein
MNPVVKLKKLYTDKEITTCELRLPGCWIDSGLTFAHRHKRIWYKRQQERLADFDQTILACIYCHMEIEYDGELTKQLFVKLRGKE